MDENSTPSRIEPKNTAAARSAMRQPRKRTIDIVRQFARCYNVTMALPASVNSIILN